MAISAFNDEGLLKKDATRGTSLAVDPGRADERSRFETLHEEARAGGMNQEQMRENLTDRFQGFGNAQNTRLAEIARQQQTMMGEAQQLRDPEQEMRFAQNAGGAMNAEFRTQTDEKWKAESGEYLRKKLKNTTPQEKKDFHEWMINKYDQEPGALWGHAADQKHWNKYRKKMNKENRVSNRKELWQNTYGNSARRENELRINREVDRINESYLPNKAEAGERRARLADRMELYNMFLGE